MTMMTTDNLNDRLSVQNSWPLRFLSVEQWHDYRDGKVTLAQLPQPCTDEYRHAPFETKLIYRD